MQQHTTTTQPRHTPVNPYQANGYASRREYLESLCEEYDRLAVYSLADVLGPSEDFDGLVTALEDFADELCFD